MASGATRDRRGRSVRGSAGLLERDSPLQAIYELLDAAQEGSGQALLIEGHAGMGKTRLHEASLDEARKRGMLLMRAGGAELEGNLAFGVAGRLMRRLLEELPESQRVQVLEEAPDRVRLLLGGGREPSSADARSDLAVSHGLFSVLAGVGETHPALLAIDDLHWSDTPSLAFILYVLHRLDELPLAVVMTKRPTTGEERAEALDLVSAHPRVRIEKLSPLGAVAVGEILHETIGDRADRGLAEVCLEVTAGNPFYLHELVRGLAEEPKLRGEKLANRARSLAPDAVTRSLRVRVGRLGEPAPAVARAVAILGDDVPLRHAAALAGVPIAQASAAADALAAVEVLLAREPLRFVHPLVRQAVQRDIPASELASCHLNAARLLYADGGDIERVAAHLLLGRAQSDRWVVEQLRAAASLARNRAAPQSAIRYLERALEEPPHGELRSRVLGELGAAEAAIASPAAPEHLAAAAAASSDPRRRAELALQGGRALDTLGKHEQAAGAYGKGLGELPHDPTDLDELELRDQLHADFVAAATLVPPLQSRAMDVSTELLERAAEGPRTQGQRLRLAQAALQGAFGGEPAAVVTERAELAWDEGRLLEHGTSEGIGWRIVTSALTLAGELERAVEVADAALEDARHRGSPLAFATVSLMRSMPRLWQARVDDALADLEHVQDTRRYGWRQFARATCAQYALCLIETGELDRAEVVLTGEMPLGEPQDLEDVLRKYAQAELRLAQASPGEALEGALATGELAERTMKFFGYCPWRTTAAQAALALGDRDRALTLAREAVARANIIEVPHQTIRTMRVLGMCQEGQEATDSLRLAVELGSSTPSRLETIKALIELGACLRRSNHRSAAREPLQRAADLAQEGGAKALYERARTELSATGARPRRDVFLSGPTSLTPSERRIAELAASGQTNREIAHMLFVTPKTVEYHLRNTYRKLAIETREELSGALSA